MCAALGDYPADHGQAAAATGRPNTLSAVHAADTVLPALLAAASDHVDVAGSHDYDRRGDRWARLRRVAGPRPVWVTEARSMLTVCLQPATGR